MRTKRTLEVESSQDLRGSVGTGTKEDELSTVRVWAARFHHVTARSRLARVLKTYEPFISLIFNVFFRPADTEPVSTGARLYSLRNNPEKGSSKDMSPS